MQIPQLETPRLILRKHRRDDFSTFSAMWADPSIVRFIGGQPSTEQQSWMRLLSYAGLWSHLGFGYWAIEEKTTGNFIGDIGFADFNRELVPSIRSIPELGWALTSRAHGKGYATEAVQGALRWGDAHLAAEKSVCLIHPENFASIRVAEKCGYREYHRTTFKDQSTILFSRSRSG